jgi:hypothetical protein
VHLGLPDDIAAIKDNFTKQHAANDGPWKRQPHNNGGGELWGSLQLQRTLGEMDPPVLMEPTGAGTASANGKAERSIGVTSITTQLLLGMTNLVLIYNT